MKNISENQAKVTQLMLPSKDEEDKLLEKIEQRQKSDYNVLEAENLKNRKSALDLCLA